MCVDDPHDHLDRAVSHDVENTAQERFLFASARHHAIYGIHQDQQQHQRDSSGPGTGRMGGQQDDNQEQ